MKPNVEKLMIQKLDTVIGLLRHLIAIELSVRGVPKQQIGKHLSVAKAKVVQMLKGIKDEHK